MQHILKTKNNNHKLSTMPEVNAMMKSIRFLIPLIFFMVLFSLFWHGLGTDTRKLPSALIGKPAPQISLPFLGDPSKRFNSADLLGKVYVLHVWATWCDICQEEHPFWVDIARKKPITIIGMLYEDDPNAAKKWLHDFGNPYDKVISDSDGKVAIDLGVYGTPETFLIDKKGVVRYKHIGAVTPKIWNQTLLPLITKLKESKSD